MALRRTFPPLSVAPVALATPPTTFVGRTHEIDAARKLLGNPSAAHVDGCGRQRENEARARTGEDSRRRLSRTVLRSSTSASSRTALTSRPSLLRALGLIDDTGTLDPLERAAARVRARSMLVIVDNCEHLLDASAEVCEALVAASGAKPCTRHEPRAARRAR